MPTLKFSSAQLQHLPELLELEKKVFHSDRLGRRQFAYHCSGHCASLMIVATVNKVVAGYFLLFFRKNSRRSRLYSLALAPQFQGQGHARPLMKYCLGQAKARGCTELSLEVRPDNAAAIALYAKLGFVQTGQRADFYQDGAPALLWKKKI